MLTKNWRLRSLSVDYVKAAFLLALAGCHSSRNVEAVVGSVTIQCATKGPAPLRIEHGRLWAMGHASPVAADGSFEVPSSATAVNAYLDQNNDGKFDRFIEPGAPCHLEASRWRCVIPTLRATVHRAISMRDKDLGDSTYVFVENYDASCEAIAQTNLCVADRCTQSQPSPFLSETGASVKMLSLCGTEGFAPADGQLKILDAVETISIAQPPAIPLPNVSISNSNASVDITMLGVTADRVLIWAGISDEAGDLVKIYWHSEDERIVMRSQGDTVLASVPAAFVDLCRRDPNCVIAAQLVKFNNTSPKLLSQTERRFTLSFR